MGMTLVSPITSAVELEKMLTIFSQKNISFYIASVFILHTGVDITKLLDLKRNHILGHKEYLNQATGITYTFSEEFIQLTFPFLETLPQEYLFFNEAQKTCYTKELFRYKFQSILQKNHLEPYTPLHLKKTFALSYLLENHTLVGSGCGYPEKPCYYKKNANFLGISEQQYRRHLGVLTTSDKLTEVRLAINHEFDLMEIKLKDEKSSLERLKNLERELLRIFQKFNDTLS